MWHGMHLTYVYGVDRSQTEFVSRYWEARESAYVPLFPA